MKKYLYRSLRQLYFLAFRPGALRHEVGFWPQESDSLETSALKTRFRNRYHYLLEMFPLIVVLVAFGNLVTGYTCEAFGIVFMWAGSWTGATIGVAVSMAVISGFGATIGVVSSVALILAFVAVSVTALVVSGVAGLGMTIGAAGSVAVCLTVGAASGLAMGMPSAIDVIGFGVTFGVTFGVSGGLAMSIAVCLVVGLAYCIGMVAASAGAYGGSFSVLSGVRRGLVGGVAFGASVAVVLGLAFGVSGAAAFALTCWLVYFRLLTYPFDVILSAAAYYLAGRRPQAAARAWRWCPVSWNEVIWLPVPFVGKLLSLLAQQDREEGFRQIAFVAAERSLQRRAVLRAQVEIAVSDLQAKSVPEMADMMGKLDWTTDAPIALPGELVAALLRFGRVAEHIGQYTVLHSAYRQGQALSRAVDEVALLQRSLMAARGRAAPRLLQVANDWRRLLEAEQKTLQAQAQARREILNPFVFGDPVAETEHNVFTGRRDIVQQVEESMLGAAQAPTLLLYGPRRMGKTSILNQLPRLLGPDFAPALVDCQNPAVTGSLATLLRYLSRSLSSGLQRRRVRMEPLTATALEREPFAAFDEWLDRAEREMPEKMRALLCLDEYERLQTVLDTDWGLTFLDALRHIIQHRPRLALMFSGAHTFQELGPVWTDRFISARRVRVSFLTREEVLPLLTEPIPEFDMTYAPGALDAIIAATGGQPFLTQAVAFELVQFLNQQQRKEATPGDVEQAIGLALVSGGEYFANVWSDAGEDGQAILSALARGETPPDSPTARAWLREHDVLNDAERFIVPMVERWVKENMQ